MIFLSKEELKLKNGGYLIGPNGPITNASFVEEQEKAHKAIVLASILKKKNFKESKVDTFEDAVKETEELLKNSKLREYKNKTSITTPLFETMKKEALDWIKNETKNSETDKLNAVMQQFNTISDFEEFGLYFNEGIVKLHKIYTIEEIKKAYESIVEHI